MSGDTLSRKFFNIPISAIVLSTCLHLAVTGFLLLSPVLQKLGISIFPRKDVFKEAYQSFIQVDVVALPDELPGEKTALDTSLPITEKPATAVEPPPKEEEEKAASDLAFPDAAKAEEAKKAEQAKKKAEAEEKKRQSQLDAALKKVQEEAKREQALKALQNKAGAKGRKKISGNIMSKGTSLTGAVGTAKDQFTARIVEAIRQNFNIYFWQQRKGLAAVIHLEFFPTGKVRKREILRRSIDPTYDSAVLQAIDATSFPVPEDPTILEDGYNITFIP